MTMKRLGIFCFYDENGVVDDYIEYLLSDLVKNLEKLIIVINGRINNNGLIMLKKYADQIVMRENKGFDAGAYREILVDVLGEKEIKKWDSIVFCNDTFYGPFISFKEIFRKMEAKKKDFWGIDYREGKFLSFLQSYFLVFERDILLSGVLYQYMRDNVSPDERDISEIYASFEVGLFSYLTKCGYEYDSFVYTKNYNVYYNSDRCIEECGLPILKKKCFSYEYFSKDTTMRTLYYIQKNYKYKMEYILYSIKRLYGIEIYLENNEIIEKCFNKSREKKIPDLAIDEKMFLDFVQKNSNIYIYGTGIIAKKIWHLFHEYMDGFKGFIVSDGEKIEKETLYHYPIIHYKSVKSGSALILGLGYENSYKVIPTLKKDDRVLVLWHDQEKSGLVIDSPVR